MPNGLYRDSGGWVHVNFDGKFEMSLHRSDYEDHEYRPKFESLPTRREYEKARKTRPKA